MCPAQEHSMVVQSGNLTQDLSIHSAMLYVCNMKEYVQGLRRKLFKGPVFRKVLCILIVFCIFWANKYMAGISIYLNGARDSPPYLYVTEEKPSIVEIHTAGTTEDIAMVTPNRRNQRTNNLLFEKKSTGEIKEETKHDVVNTTVATYVKTHEHFDIKQKVEEIKLSDRESVQQKEATRHSENLTALDWRGNPGMEYHGIDLMTLPTYTFDPAYKNPCWKDNGTLRCLPYFFLIGVKKSGTTALWRHISRHPDFAFQTLKKEQQWFAVMRFNKTTNWVRRNPNGALLRDNFDAYINLFKQAAIMIDRNKCPIKNKRTKCHSMITGDGSTTYLHLNSHWRYLPGNENCDEPKYVILDYIRHFLPQAKIIIIFRDPVERLYSEYYHEFGRLRPKFNSSPKHFHAVVVSGLNMYNECLQNRTLRSCVYDETIYDKTVISIQLGIYCVYWQELLRLFPRKQILVLQHAELIDMTRMQNTVFEFLEMDTLSPSRQDKDQPIYTRRPVDASKGPMLNETRTLLYNFYRPFNEEMSRLYGDPVFLYKQTLILK